MTDLEKFKKYLEILEILKSYIEIEESVDTLGEGTFYPVDIITFNGIEVHLSPEEKKLIKEWLNEVR